MKLNYAQYKERAKLLATMNAEPSETDQSGSDETDINVIVKRYGVYGTIPQGTTPPQFGTDLSEIPTDLRDVIESARMLEIYRGELPVELRALNVDDLLTKTPQEIAAILNPPTKPAANSESTT
ncbi:MAG: internal scaffolding protein [Arizlama microvirus]|nr:MAG: internal scaffolding protein [Arizlama microvirus]